MKKTESRNPKRWFAIGDEEFEFAEHSFERGDKFYSQICFYFQQAVEKYLKGYLLANNIVPPKIHDIGSLCMMCAKINKEFKDFIDESSMLNKFYIGARYPLHFNIFTKKDTGEAHKIAKEIILFIKKDLLK